MKKLSKLILALFLGVSLVACSSEVKEFQKVDVTMSEVTEKIENKEDFVMIIERENCSYCEAIDEYIEETKNEHPDLTLYKVDSTDFKLSKPSDDATTLVSDTEDGKKLLEIAPNFFYTPTIYVVKEGKVEQAAIGFGKTDKTVSVGGLDSPIDFDTAPTKDFWEFISQ